MKNQNQKLKSNKYFFYTNNILILSLIFTTQVFASKTSLNNGADTFSLYQVIASTFKHHPMIMSQMKELDQAKQYVRQSLGAFDLNLKSDAQGYTDGYYDGQAFNVFLEKPLFYLNSKAYAGYRKSDGTFPVYNDQLTTLSEGEAFAGAMISLLRDRSIDDKRFKNIIARQNLVQSELELKNQYVELQTMAANAYYKWLSHLEKVRVQIELLSLAESRVQNFSTRIRKGDLAKIYGLENEQYILKRQINLNQDKQKLYQASLYLSLFYRDSNGSPIIIKESNLTKMGELKNKKVKDPIELLNLVNAQDLMIQNLQSQIQQTVADRKMGYNELLPKLDLKYEISDDSGAGNTNLDPLQQSVYLNMALPIERRLGQGRLNAAKAKREALEIKIKFKKEKNQIEVMSLLNNLKLFKQNYELTQKQIGLADKLRDSEIIKFNKGASDFILVNLREENFAESKIKNIKAYLDYNRNFVELQRLAVDLIIPIPN